MGGVGVAAVAIEGETEKRSQRSDSRVLLRIRIGIGCGNDDDQEPAAILASRRQHRCSQCIALGVGILTWLSGRPCMRWRAGRCGIRMGRAALIRSLVSFEEARAGARIVLDTGACPLLAFVENPPKKFSGAIQARKRWATWEGIAMRSIIRATPILGMSLLG